MGRQPAAPRSSGSGGGGNGKTYTVGILTDLTGPAASASKTSPQGVQAGPVRRARGTPSSTSR